MKLYNETKLLTEKATVVNASDLENLIKAVYLVPHVEIFFDVELIEVIVGDPHPYFCSAEDIVNGVTINEASLPVVMDDLANLGYIETGLFIVRSI